MNDMEKQMRELALEMFEIKEKIESAKRADLPDKIRDFAIKELNERYEDKYDQFHNLEISYNTEMYKINSAKLKEKYEARAAEKQKAFDDAIAETQKRNNYILEFIKQDPSARVTYNRTNDLSYIDKMYGPQIDMFIRHQEEALKEPVVVNEEQVIEPVVGVPETVIPEVKNEEVSVGDVEPVQEPVEQTEENESATETVIPEVKNEEVSVGDVEPVQEPVEQTEENESANNELVPEQQQETKNSLIQDDGLKGAMLTADVTEQNYEIPKEPMTVEEGNIKEDTQKHGVSEKAQAENSVIQNTNKEKEEFEQNKEYISQTTPEKRSSVSSIKEALNSFKDKINLHKDAAIGFAKAVAVGAVAAWALLTAGPAAGAILAGGLQLAAPATTTVLGASAVHEFNKGRKG